MAMSQRLAARSGPDVIQEPSSIAPPRRLMAESLGSAGDALLAAGRQLMQDAQPTMADCPFDSTPLPLAPHEIGADPHMMSVYIHQSLVNCLLWGLYRSGTLQATIEVRFAHMLGTACECRLLVS
jgi:hypothetical protein